MPQWKLPDLFTELPQAKGTDLQRAVLPGCTGPLLRLSYGLQGRASQTDILQCQNMSHVKPVKSSLQFFLSTMFVSVNIRVHLSSPQLTTKGGIISLVKCGWSF